MSLVLKSGVSAGERDMLTFVGDDAITDLFEDLC